MAAAAAILDLVSVDFLTSACVDWLNFLVAHWGDWRKVPFDDKLCHSSKISAILDLVSIDFLTKTWVDWSYFLVAHCGN
jgi:Fe-S cluster assembly iron-binding protein IscA